MEDHNVVILGQIADSLDGVGTLGDHVRRGDFEAERAVHYAEILVLRARVILGTLKRGA
jgi:hypothetical protein